MAGMAIDHSAEDPAMAHRHATGLDWPHLHDLRHASATFLLDQDEQLQTVTESLRHSTIL